MAKDKKIVVFLTGATGFIGKRITAYLLSKGIRVYALTRQGSETKLLRYLEKKKIPTKQLKLVIGDVMLPNLVKGIDDRKEVETNANVLIHNAAIYDLSVSRPVAKRVNVEGTRVVLEFAKNLKNLKKFLHVSTIAVSGDYRGIFFEEMLDVGQSFTDHYGKTKFISEKLVREWQKDLPITIVRPGAVIGETTTGETEKFDGPYMIMDMAYYSRFFHPISPGKDDVYMEVVSVDGLAEVICEIAMSDRTTGKTFTICDPDPVSLSEFIDMIYSRFSMYRPFLKFSLSPISKLLSLPAVKVPSHYIGKLIGYPVEGIHYISRPVIHDNSNTVEFIAKKGIKYKRLPDYFDNIFDYYMKNRFQRN